jgi:hypothetical protein
MSDADVKCGRPRDVTQKSVTIKSGGTITLSIPTNVLLWVAEDRAFVFDLIDRLTAYEKGGAARVRLVDAVSSKRADPVPAGGFSAG